MNHQFIAIEGNIGAGKTTLSKMIANKYGGKLVLEEFADNPFLPKFYKDAGKYAFPLELSFLAERYQQLKEEMTSADLFNPLVVSDYIFQKCLLFAKVNLPEAEYQLFSKLFNIIQPLLPKPDLLVYLYLSIPDLQKNIAKRGRAYEQKIPDEYLHKIQDSYLDHFKGQPEQCILILDMKGVNFVNNPKHFEHITQLLEKSYTKGIHRISIETESGAAFLSPDLSESP